MPAPAPTPTPVPSRLPLPTKAPSRAPLPKAVPSPKPSHRLCACAWGATLHHAAGCSRHAQESCSSYDYGSSMAHSARCAGQCGGISGCTGSDCISGQVPGVCCATENGALNPFSCQAVSAPYYYQCVPGGAIKPAPKPTALPTVTPTEMSASSPLPKIAVFLLPVALYLLLLH